MDRAADLRRTAWCLHRALAKEPGQQAEQTEGQADMVPAGLEQAGLPLAQSGPELGLAQMELAPGSHGPRPETAGGGMSSCGDADDGPMPIRKNTGGGLSHVNTGIRGSSGTGDGREPAGHALYLVGTEAT
ncbi:unnamed protein product [Merluccius merluccius]